MLYVIATPIGNMGDWSHRAVEVVPTLDYLLCEDTRHTRGLLDRYGLSARLVSCHGFSEASRIDGVINDLKAGKSIGLVSDAGTPAINDPGQRLVAACRAAGVEVTALPGACAAINALVLSGLPSEKFQFIGFVPRKEGEIRRMVVSAMAYDGVTIAYESPKRLAKTLEFLSDAEVVVAREMTKKFEEVVGPADLGEIRGEVVLLIQGHAKQFLDWNELGPQEAVNAVVAEYGISKQEAIKVVASMRGVPKREVYREVD